MRSECSTEETPKKKPGGEGGGGTMCDPRNALSVHEVAGVVAAHVNRNSAVIMTVMGSVSQAMELCCGASGDDMVYWKRSSQY